MRKSQANQRTFHLRDENLADVHAFAQELLTRKDVSAEKASKSLLILEALMQALLDWGLDEDTSVQISGTDRLGDFRIEVKFEGEIFTPNEADDSIEGRVLAAHNDKIDYGYHSGYNIITVTAKRSNRTSMFACAIAILLAVAVYLPLGVTLDTNVQRDLLDNYVFPLEQLYGNAMLMVGAPMTFFSLLKNLTDTYVVSRTDSGMRKLQLRTLGTSVLAIVMALVSFPILSGMLAGFGGTATEFGGSLDRSFADIVTSLMPPSIFEPFAAISPIPLIGVALLFTYALCSAGKYFDALRQAMMACYTLFSRMLHAIIAALPVFCFFAVLDGLLESGMFAFIEILVYFATFYAISLLLFATYAIRLRAHGIKVVPFVRKLGPLLRENVKIGSAIDAAPYNIRYCTKVYKMKRSLLERIMPVLAEINLDGNCFILTFFTLMFIFVTSTPVTWLSLITLAALIIFLSLGAPNQPGSILIGSLIITMYLNSFEVIAMAIVAEALFGSAQNLINVIGDIVMAAIDNHKAAKQQAEQGQSAAEPTRG